MRDLETDRRGGGREGEERGRGRERRIQAEDSRGTKDRDWDRSQGGERGGRKGSGVGKGDSVVRKWSVGDVTLHGGGLEMRMVHTGPLPRAWRASWTTVLGDG